MSKQLSKPADKSADQSLQTASWVRTIRETVESVVIAFILAFMFRTFEAEAFVIPTGSMAPTLQGRHKDIVCPECGYEFRAGASEEVERDSNAPIDNCKMVSATCPMCRYRVVVDPNDPQSQGSFPSYNGDRIIVNKFAYDVSDPQRWDVVVFKYPEKSTENYIKRLVGLPNERVWLHHGDVYVAPLDSSDFHIARKPPEKVNETLQPVYDNDYVVEKLIKAGMPSRWQPWASEGAPSPWKMSDDYKSFSADNSDNQTAWIRYQHLLPSEAIWNSVLAGRQVQSPLPTLIHDFYAYNEGDFSGCRQSYTPTPVWVGDLALDFTANVKSDSGTLTLELVKGGRQFQCQINLADGRAKLSISGKPDFQPVGDTLLHGAGKYDLRFANVDQQLLLWVNGKLIEFDVPTTYDDLKNTQPIEIQPVAGSRQATDLSPVGIGIAGGSVEVSHLNIRRDVYYLSHDDAGWSNMATLLSSINLDHDQFFMLGDNSPKSSDGRFWSEKHYVDRRLLIGKALFVYWPHSFNYVEVGNKHIPFPYWPNFGRMRFVH